MTGLDEGARDQAAEPADMFGADDVQTPGHDVPLKTAIGGLLRADAVVVDHDALVRIQALLEQRIGHHPQALPVLVTWPVPDQGDYASTRAHADRLCARLKAGAGVVALGEGLEAGTHHKQPVFRMLNVVGLRLEAELAAG